MLHEPAGTSGHDDRAKGAKAILGIRLFWVYSAIYAGFVAINTLAPGMMETKVLLGQNLATAYGFGLIILAIVLGLAYNRMCGVLEDNDTGTTKGSR